MNLALDESTQERLPQILEDILKRTLIGEKSNKLKETDIFLILVVVLLSENGFLLMKNHNTKDSQCLQHIDNTNLSTWKISTGVHEISFVLSGYSDIIIKLVLCALGRTSLINVVISDLNPEVYSVGFLVNHYIVDPEASTIPMMFHNLKHLSDTFKNKIITPVKSTILNYYGFSGASLKGLPEELMFNLLLLLPVSDIINVAKTCKKFFILLNNESFWHKLFLRDFPHKVGTAGSLEWKISYRIVYIAHQESVRRVRNLRSSMMDLRDRYDYTSSYPIMDIIL